MYYELFRRTVAAVSAILLVAGCDAKVEQVPVFPVTGQIFYEGKPAAGVQVYLMPTSAPTIPLIPSNPFGVSDPEGNFKLSTYGKEDGAPAGGYQVVLLWPDKREGTEESSENDTDRLLGWYGAVHSTLTAQIAEGANQLPPFRIPAVTKPPEAVAGVPGRN